MINLGIDNLLKKIVKGFLNYVKFVGVDQIAYKKW